MTPSVCTLYGEPLWISPYVFSAFVALREKDIPFEVVEIDLAEGQQLEASYRDRSLTARVPSLEHNGFTLAESSAIAEYLDEAFPAPTYPALFPADRQVRARARQVIAWIRSDLAALRDERSTLTMFYPCKPQPLSPAAARDAAKLVRVAEQLIPADGAPLFGSWSLADSELGFMLHRLILNHNDVPPAVRAYAERQWSRPSVQGFAGYARPASPTS